jgi:molybdopterin converting factor small subunit
MIRVTVPRDTKGLQPSSDVQVNATNLGQVVNQLEKQIPGIKKLLCNGAGEIHSDTFDFFVNGKSTHPSSSKTPVKDGDEVIVVPLEDYQHG